MLEILDCIEILEKYMIKFLLEYVYIKTYSNTFNDYWHIHLNLDHIYFQPCLFVCTFSGNICLFKRKNFCFKKNIMSLLEEQ